MRAQLASEMLKLRSTRTTAGLAVAMLGVVVTAVGLHGYGLPASKLDTAADQLTFLIGWGEVLGALFAGLLGAMSFTGEVRYGTIRPTLLVTPQRSRVVASKCLAGSMAGFVLGLLATSIAAATGWIVLDARGLDVALDGGDVLQLIAGGAAAAALWAVIGLGVGAIVRNQVPTLVGLLAWLLFIEGVLVDNVSGVGRFAPGALGQAASGLHPDRLLAPALGALLLAIYAAAALAAGAVATTRRDFT
jgi:ABC-2 type transport system permease protein